MKGSTGGEIVQVQGGHIVRATGRKDRHSKVYTAKGPRDRRVRLSAHTAIQFYDVQDRLGYDRPSKAVDWLIKKAKTAIDKLAELPPWHPFDTNMGEANQNANAAGSTADQMVIADQSESSGYSSFIAPSLDPDAIRDTMKSLFPISSSTASSMNFQSYASRSGNANQDLGLSLHPFQDQDFTMNWISNSNNNNNNNTSADDRGGLMNRGFNLHPPPLPLPLPLPLMSSQDTDFSHHQRGTLQSSFSNPFRAWNDLAMANSSADHHSHRTQDVHRQWFAPEGLSGFGIPGRIHGEEEQSVVSDRPSSSSPHSQH